ASSSICGTSSSSAGLSTRLRIAVIANLEAAVVQRHAGDGNLKWDAAELAWRDGLATLHRRNQVLRTRSPARDDPDRIGERHVHRMHPLRIANVAGPRERRRDRRDEDGVAPVLELLDDEPRDEGIFDLN